MGARADTTAMDPAIQTLILEGEKALVIFLVTALG